jgi:hypothetical protein
VPATVPYPSSLDLPYEHSAKSGDFSQTTHTYESTRIFAQCHERDLPVITTPFNERAREIQADSLKEPVVSCRRIHGSVDARVVGSLGNLTAPLIEVRGANLAMFCGL